MGKEFRNLYWSPEDAYGSIDFQGRAFIKEEDFLNSLVFNRVPYSKEDIIQFLRLFNLFPLNGGNRQKQTDSGHVPVRGVMIFDTFKKTFFPHYH